MTCNKIISCELRHRKFIEEVSTTQLHPLYWMQADTAIGISVPDFFNKAVMLKNGLCPNSVNALCSTTRVRLCCEPNGLKPIAQCFDHVSSQCPAHPWDYHLYQQKHLACCRHTSCPYLSHPLLNEESIMGSKFHSHSCYLILITLFLNTCPSCSRHQDISVSRTSCNGRTCLDQYSSQSSYD